MNYSDQICGSNNFENGWGFYVDLENLPPVLKELPRPKQDTYNYEYFAEYYEDFEAGYDDYYNTYIPHSEGTNKDMHDNFGAIIVRISSTTIITAAITYVLLFVL